MDNLNHLRQQLEEKLIEKAVKDPTFRKQLIDKPEETIEQFAKVKLPANVKITVLEEAPGMAYIVLPSLPTHDEGNELSEQDLLAIAAAGDGYSIHGCEETYALFCKGG